jgi:phosphate transport system substrate-binding protein
MTRNRFLFDRHMMKSAALAAALFLCATPAVAEDPVTVTSQLGGLTLTGRVIGFDGTYLTIESDYGPLSLVYDRVSCVGTDCPDPATWYPQVRLSGADRLAEILMPGLLEAFARSRSLTADVVQTDADHLSITLADAEGQRLAGFALRATTTDEGFADLVTFQADAVLAMREVRPGELSRAEEVGLMGLTAERQSHVLGLDALVPVVSPLETVDRISLSQLARLYAGGTTGLTPYLTSEDDGQAQAFEDRLLRTARLTLSDDVMRQPDATSLTEVIGVTPGAIGMVNFGNTATAQAISIEDSCGYVAVPTLTALKTQDYPLTLPLFLYLGQQRQPQVMQDFLTWLRTPEAHLVVRRAGFVDQGPIPIPLDAQGQRFVNAIKSAGPDLPLEELQRLVAVLTAHTRLSTTFRFEVGGTRLEAASRSNLRDLALTIEAGTYAGRDVLLAGFSDGQGDAAANLALSEERAQAVADALMSLLGDAFPEDVSLTVAAFGEALPMGCDDTVWGRSANRRVELWVGD